LAVTLARLAPSDTWDTKNYWGGWAAFFGFAGAISVVFVIPVMVLMLRLRDWRVGYFLVGFYSIVAGVVFLGIVAIFDKNFRDSVLTRNGFMEALSILVAFATFGILLGAGLMTARARGIELVFGAKARSGSDAPQTHQSHLNV